MARGRSAIRSDSCCSPEAVKEAKRYKPGFPGSKIPGPAEFRESVDVTRSSCCRALQAWYTDQETWAALTRRVMQQDWSWAEPALDYIEVYFKALKGT